MNGPGWEDLLKAVRVRILGFAKYLGCGEDAEDIVQETLLVLDERYAAVQDTGEVLKLAARICANLAMNWRRRRLSSGRTVEISTALADPLARSAETVLIEEELQQRLLKAIRDSGERCRTAAVAPQRRQNEGNRQAT